MSVLVLVPVLVDLAVLRYEKQSLQKQSLQPSDTCIWALEMSRLRLGEAKSPPRSVLDSVLSPRVREWGLNPVLRVRLLPSVPQSPHGDQPLGLKTVEAFPWMPQFIPGRMSSGGRPVLGA